MRDFGEIPTDHEFDNGDLTLVMDDCNPGASCMCLPGYFKRLTVTAKVCNRCDLQSCLNMEVMLRCALFVICVQLSNSFSKEIGCWCRRLLTNAFLLAVQDRNNRLSFTLERPRACPIACLPWPLNCMILCPLKVFVRGPTGELAFTLVMIMHHFAVARLPTVAAVHLHDLPQ